MFSTRFLLCLALPLTVFAYDVPMSVNNEPMWLALQTDRKDYKQTTPPAAGQPTRLQALHLQQQALSDRYWLRQQQEWSNRRRQDARVGLPSSAISPSRARLESERALQALRLHNYLQRQAWPRR